ncbi:MAG: hypothetical protein ISR75_06925 [Phycisphaerales bacterium]|nr:hypothetical protein [Phycisphaerales bacterium]
MRLVLALLLCSSAFAENLHYTYLWHLEQPIYWPDQQNVSEDRYERAWQSILRKDAGSQHPENNLRSIFGLDDRVAAYQYRPHDAIGAISWAPEAGAQISFSGGLIENIQSFSEAGGQLGYVWDWNHWLRDARTWYTNSGGTNTPRADVVLFGFHHPLFPLISDSTAKKEIQLYKEIYGDAWGYSAPMSKGFFPSEMAFSERLIPILEEEGIEWTFVSSEKVSRACTDFPVVYGSGGINCDPPNKADQLNPAQGSYFRLTIDRGVSPAEAAPFAYQPHYAKYVNPSTGAESRVIIVPCSQSLGWVDGYSPIGTAHFGTLQQYNDPSNPMLVVLAHDGDNAWGGGFSYYSEATPNLAGQAVSEGYTPTVVQKFLSDHPVSENDVVHVEDGAWVNADGDFGAPQFLNWNWPPVNSSGQIDVENGWAEDVRNWAVITAAQNYVDTAEQISIDNGNPMRINHILYPRSETSSSERAWHYFLGSLNSGYMYYGTALDMEVKPTIACNEAIEHANAAIANGNDQTPPEVWIPQRFPWNPGSANFGPHHGYQEYIDDGDFHVWTFAYDVSGLENAKLLYRIDQDGNNPLSSNANEVYSQSNEVGSWIEIPMTVTPFPAGNVHGDDSINFFEMPDAIANRCVAEIVDVRESLVDYFVQAEDSLGNITKSPIQHVWIGDGEGSSGGGGGAAVEPDPLVAGGTATVSYDGMLAGGSGVNMHYGFNGWSSVPPEVAMAQNPKTELWEVTVSIPTSATQFDFVFNDGNGNWDNNNGQDWHIPVEGGKPGDTWVMDGTLDTNAILIAENNNRHLWAGVIEDQLYIATEPASENEDVFMFVSEDTSGMNPAPWGKSGFVASWSGYLAQEGTNGWIGWFDSTSPGNVEFASDTILEGIYVLGTIDAIALAVAPYETDDNGELLFANQVPQSIDGDTDVQANEYILLEMCQLTQIGCCLGDIDQSGTIDVVDLLAVVALWGTDDTSADINNDGVVNVPDLLVIIDNWGTCE